MPGIERAVAGSHGDQKRPPPVAELFAGGLFEELDSFSECRSKILRGACFAVDGRGTKADRKYEGGRHRQAERGHARLVGGLSADDVGGILLRRFAADAGNLHAHVVPPWLRMRFSEDVVHLSG
jgi:hypothetical protein